MQTQKYILTANEKQVELLTFACNQALRIHIGQLADPLTFQLNFEVAYPRHHYGKSCPIEVAEKLEELSRLCWKTSNGYGYDDKSRAYWELYQMFKNANGRMSDSSFILDVHQMELLRNVCEHAARLIAGQMDYTLVDELVQAYEKSYKDDTEKLKDTDKVRTLVKEEFDKLHTLCWDLPVNADHGMNYDDNSDILWDMYQVIRHQLWNDNQKGKDNFWCVSADEPMQTSKEKFIQVEKATK